MRSVRHRADFFFHFGDIHHDDGVPGAAIEEAAVGAFAEALLAADALERVNLDAAERRIVFVGHPEHAIFHRAVLHAGWRPGAAGAALGNHGQFFRLFLARRGDSLGAGFKFLLVGHQSGGFDNLRCVRHFQQFYPECQGFVSVVLAPGRRLLQCPCIQAFACTPCSPRLSTNICCPRSLPDLPCGCSSSCTSLFIPEIPLTTKSWPATGCTAAFTASIPTDGFLLRTRARPAIRLSSRRFIFWLAPAGKPSCSRRPSSTLPVVCWPRGSPLACPAALPTRLAGGLPRRRSG